MGSGLRTISALEPEIQYLKGVLGKINERFICRTGNF
jgi:hypothetical protein